MTAHTRVRGLKQGAFMEPSGRNRLQSVAIVKVENGSSSEREAKSACKSGCCAVPQSTFHDGK